MAHIHASRIKETTTTTGTGNITLAAFGTGFRRVGDLAADNDTVDYYLVASNGDWERGRGTWLTGHILARTTVRESTNANAAITLPAGTHTLMVGPQLGTFIPDVTLTAAVDGDITRESGLLYAQLAGVKCMIGPRTPRRRTILLSGSSNMNGFGIVGNQGYAQLATNILVSNDGWVVVNVAQDGTTSTQQLPVLEDALKRYAPDVVLLGPSMGAEGMSGAGSAAACEDMLRVLMANTKEKIRLCLESGATPIILGVAPRDAYNSTFHVDYLHAADLVLANLGVPYVHFLGTISDNAGNWLAGMSDDAIHPNATGAAAMSKCIQLSTITCARPEVPSPPTYGYKAVMAVNYVDGAQSGWCPLKGRIAVDTADDSHLPTSITIMGWFKMPLGQADDNNGVLNAVLSTDTILRIRTASAESGNFGLASGSSLVTSSINPVSTRAWHHVCLRVNGVTGSASMLIDGANIGSSTLTAGQTISALSFGGRNDNSVPSEGIQIGGFKAYRTALPDSIVLADFNGMHYPGSCIINCQDFSIPRVIPVNLAVGNSHVLADTARFTIVTDFINPATEAALDNYVEVIATNGGSYTIPDGIETVYLKPAGTIAGFTLTMCAASRSGDIVAVAGVDNTITALTHNAGTSKTFASGAALTTSTDGAFQRFQLVGNVWRRIG